MMHPAGREALLMVDEDDTWASAWTAAVHSDCDVIVAGHLPLVRIVDEVTTFREIRLLHGHSIRGLRPLCSWVMLFCWAFGKNHGW
mmetsp:Transcript_29819/g.57670  ORF Transcript_29819/g.57670 Transcript_29819/m.57670 type:complete len:86 (+) Transcript_29819:425-682(+)